MGDDLRSKHEQEREGLRRDNENRDKDREAANARFRAVVRSIGRDAAIAEGQRKERDDRREYRSGLITEITTLKSDLARQLDACPFPSVLAHELPSTPPVKEQWQHALDAIDPFAGDGEARMKQLRAQVHAYRTDANPLRATSFAFGAVVPSGAGFVEKQRLTEALGSFERRLDTLIMYAKWWQTA